MSTSGPTEFPATSLIICSRNRAELLADTVGSILQGARVPAELIIIDQSDNPHPSLSSYASEGLCEIRYHWTHAIGVSRGRNTGLRMARHDIIAITDDDMLATTDWFDTLIGSLVESGPLSVVIGQVLMAEDRAPGSFAPSTTRELVPVVYKGRVGRDVLYSGNMALYRSALDRVGRFDERLGPGTSFPAAEDNDLGFRLLEAGYRIIFTPGALLYHRAWRSEHDYFRLRWSYGVGQGAYYAKHLSLRDRYMLGRLFSDVRRRFVQALRHLIQERRRAAGDALFALGVLIGALRWSTVRPRS
jgi:GT2 family glycosyltransferase